MLTISQLRRFRRRGELDLSFVLSNDENSTKAIWFVELLAKQIFFSLSGIFQPLNRHLPVTDTKLGCLGKRVYTGTGWYCKFYTGLPGKRVLLFKYYHLTVSAFQILQYKLLASSTVPTLHSTLYRPGSWA